MFLDAGPMRGGAMNYSRAAKLRPTQILQGGAPSLWVLEDADHQYVIVMPRGSHSKLSGRLVASGFIILRYGNLEDKALRQLPESVQILPGFADYRRRTPKSVLFESLGQRRRLIGGSA